MNFITSFTENCAKDWTEVMAETPTWAEFCSDCSSFAQSPDFLPCLVMFVGLILVFVFAFIADSHVNSDAKRAGVLVGMFVILLVTFAAVFILCRITGSDFLTGMFM